MDLAISDDIFSLEVLDDTSFAELYVLREQYPDVYRNRVNRPAELFLKLLVAIVYDDVDLFEIAWLQSERKLFIGIIADLVANTMADRDVVVVPRKIFVFLLRDGKNSTLKTHLRLDYTLFGLLIRDRELIELMIRYGAVETSPRLIWTSTSFVTVVQLMNTRDRNRRPYRYLDSLLVDTSSLLIGDLVESSYPEMLSMHLLTDERRTKLLNLRSNIVQFIWQDQQRIGMRAPRSDRSDEYRPDVLEEIRSLGAYTQPPTNFTELNRVKRFTPYYAAFWYNALFNPDNYPELVPILNDDGLDLILPIMERTLIRPDRFMDAELNYLSRIGSVGDMEDDLNLYDTVDDEDISADIRNDERNYRIDQGIATIDALTGIMDVHNNHGTMPNYNTSNRISRSGRRIAVSRLLQWLHQRDRRPQRGVPLFYGEERLLHELQPFRQKITDLASGL
jgi:hypothetical protein